MEESHQLLISLLILLGNLYKSESTHSKILFTKLRNISSPFFPVDAGLISVSGNHTFFTAHHHMSALATQGSRNSAFSTSVVNLTLTNSVYLSATRNSSTQF